jgi:Spy/CpxP family protein refolding chaperone
MTPEQWHKMEELFHAARERGPDALAYADPELRREVEALLAQDASDGKLLNQPRLAGQEGNDPARRAAFSRIALLCTASVC